MFFRRNALLIGFALLVFGAGGAFWLLLPDESQEDKLLARLVNTDPAYPYVVMAVAKLGPPIVPRLIELLEHSDPDRQRAAAEVLERIADPRALQPLRSTALATADDQVRSMCIAAIGATYSPRAECMIREFLDHEDPEFQKLATVAISAYRPDFRPLLQRPMEQDDSPVVRAAALSAMVSIDMRSGKDPKQVIELLRKASVDPNFQIRKTAVKCLWNRDFVAAGSLDILAEGLADQMPEVRGAAVETLGDLGAAESVPLLEPVAAGDPDPRVRGEATCALAELGRLGELATPEAVAALHNLLQGRDLRVNDWAAMALDGMAATSTQPGPTEPGEEDPFHDAAITRAEAWSLLEDEFGSREAAEKMIEDRTGPWRPASPDALLLRFAELVAAKRQAVPLRQRLLHGIDHRQLLADCRRLMSRIDEFDPVYNTVYPTSPRLPESIRQLGATRIYLSEYSVSLSFENPPYRCGLDAFADADEGERDEDPSYHWKPVIDGLWFYDTNPQEFGWGIGTGW